MTIDQLRYFLAAAKFQSIAQAGKSVAISPSAVSTAISQLEEELRCSLFHRKGKYIFLNDQGKYLKEEIEKLFDHIEVVIKNLGNIETQVQGHYRLGGSHFLSIRYLCRAWTSLQKQFPRLSAELCSMHTGQVIHELLQGRMDFALCFSPLRHPELLQIPLYTGQLRFAVRKGHPLLKSNTGGMIKDLCSYPAVIHKSSPGIEICEKHPLLKKFRIEPRVHLLFDSDDQAIECLLASDAWAMIPDIVEKAYRGQIEFISTRREWHAPYSICAVIPSHRSRNQSLQMLIERLKMVLNHPKKA